MDRNNQIAGLGQPWTPPDGLWHSPPREVSLTGNGRALLGLAVALLACAPVAGILLGVLFNRQADERRLLREQGVPAQARITRLWRHRGEQRRHRAEYTFTANASEYHGQTELARRIWITLAPGSPLPVRYLPTNPDLHQVGNRERKAAPLWVAYLVAVAVATGGGLALLPIRSQRRLLSEGRPALAVVSKHTKGQHGQVSHYEFQVLSGATAAGRCGPAKKPAAIGSTLCVLYNPDNPRWNAPYPLSLVRLSQ